MPSATKPKLTLGRVYRTEDLRRWSKNPSRLAERLVRDGVLRRLARGLFVHPKRGRFGEVPPSDEEVLRAFLKGERFLITGPERWNALGLGSTAAFSQRLVYNPKRSGEFDLGGSKFLLRRLTFPRKPPAEWFVVDLIENHDRAGVSLDEIEERLSEAIADGRFDAERLEEMAREFGTRRTESLVVRAAAEVMA
jgi:hypothetical protein